MLPICTDVEVIHWGMDNLSVTALKEKVTLRAGEIVQQLRTFAVLAEVLNSVSSTYLMAHKDTQLHFQGSQCSPGLHGHCVHVVYLHADKILIHKVKNKYLF